MEPYTFHSKPKKQKNSPQDKFFILQEAETPKKFPTFWETEKLKKPFVFQERKLSYIQEVTLRG